MSDYDENKALETFQQQYEEFGFHENDIGRLVRYGRLTLRFIGLDLKLAKIAVLKDVDNGRYLSMNPSAVIKYFNRRGKKVNKRG